jgi:hypothetical protein
VRHACIDWAMPLWPAADAGIAPIGWWSGRASLCLMGEGGVGARKQRRELLLRLEEKRNQYQDADASWSAGLTRLVLEGEKRGYKDDEVTLRLRGEMRAAQDHRGKCKRDFFLAFAELLSVKIDRAEQLAGEMDRIVFEAGRDGFLRGEMPHHQQPPALIRAEGALRTALGAMAALSEVERGRVGNVLWLDDKLLDHDEERRKKATKEIEEYVGNNGGPWIEALYQLANAVATAIGTGSISATDGELDVNRENWALLSFIQRLWRLVHEYGGQLNYSRTRGKGGGSLMTALRILEPLLPKGMLENPPYAAIEGLINGEKERSPVSL